MVTCTYRGTIPLTDTAWQSLAARDARADVKFLYGVRTMNVVCRPSCPSRRPNRENVELFTTFDEAVAAGYRACKRCHPDAPRTTQTVHFATITTSLGEVLVARSPRGVCSIAMGDAAAPLLQALQARFPTAHLVHDAASLADALTRVRRFIEDPSVGLDLDLDLQGTAFQLSVWSLLRDLACGTTATYTEVARRLGRPHAVRAVAKACASNPVALAVPCHRVVRSDGTESGYAWGLPRKRILLQREAA